MTGSVPKLVPAYLSRIQPTLSRRQARRIPSQPHDIRGHGSLLSSHSALPPTPLLTPLRLLEKDMFPGQGLQQPLHFGLEFHNGLTVTGIFLWSRQEVEKEKGVVNGRPAGR